MLCLAALPASVAADDTAVYRWRDEAGHVHYGDKPPAAGAEEITLEPAPAPDPILDRSRARSDRLLDVLEQERREKEAQSAADQQHRKQLSQQCREVANRMERTRQAGFVYQPTDDPDNPRILSDAERQEYLADMEKWYGRQCK